ncbi:MAG TPA: hypothetical protein VNK48_14540 [Xanthobacteraceae bacterium]|nr:hypothetical protein [Xanthobacteraceae bacterium]
MRLIKIASGYRIKSGKLVKVTTAKSVSQRLKERGSKKVRVVPKGSL